MLYCKRMAGKAEKGKLIVIEGNDGSGKTTQLNLLKNYFKKIKKTVKTFDFPQYSKFHGKMVGKFYMGNFGNIEQLSPYLLTYPFAMDRASVANEISEALQDGKTVLTNRYATSNLAHQGGRLPSSQFKKFVDWDIEFEYKENKLPKEDLVIYLFVPHQVSSKLMENKDRSSRLYTKGEKKDMFEKDKNYLTSAEIAYLKLVKRFRHWVKIDCVNKKGEMLSREEIHELVKDVLKKRKLI